MTILLCSADDTVIKRWEELLGSKYTFDQVNTINKLKTRCSDNSIKLILIHRSLIDTDTFIDFRHASPLSKIFLLSDLPNEEEGLAHYRRVRDQIRDYVASLPNALESTKHG